MFFDSWAELWRLLVVGVLAYAWLILVLRVTGKRTLSKMNAFDFAITVAFGSTLASILLSKDVSLTEGMLALALLAAMQWVVAWLSERSERFRRIVKAEPTMLLFRGEMIESALKRERVAREEVYAAVRESGSGGIEDVHAVVLETDGSFSVVTGGSGTAISYVRSAT